MKISVSIMVILILGVISFKGLRSQDQPPPDQPMPDQATPEKPRIEKPATENGGPEKSEPEQPDSKKNRKNSRDKVAIKVYGFVKVDYKYATEATTFQGAEGLRRANYAKRQTESDDHTSRSALQANQSRVGVKINILEKAGATIEIDFDRHPDMDNTDVGDGLFNDYFRFRQAFLTYKFQPWLEMAAGKKWDLFAPLNPNTYNVTSLLFGTGNVGWMRDQVELHFSGKDRGLHIGIGNIGYDGSGVGPNNSLVHNKSPAYLAQFYSQIGRSMKLIVSGITAHILYRSTALDNNQPLNETIFDYPNVPYVNSVTGDPIIPNKVRRSALGIALGLEIYISDSLELTGEFVRGRNLGDMYTYGISRMNVKSGAGRLNDTHIGVLDTPELTILRGNLINSDFQSTYERDGWIDLRYRINPVFTSNVFFGATLIENPSYLYEAVGDLTRSQGALSPGDVQEAHLYGANINYEPIPDFQFYFEYNFLKTIYHESERKAGMLANVISYNPVTGQVNVDVQNPIVQAALASSAPWVTVTGFYYYNLYNRRAAPNATAHLFNFGTMFRF